MREVVDLVIPDLPAQEAIVATIVSQPAYQHEKAVRQQKRANSESHKREHENFLGARAVGLNVPSQAVSQAHVVVFSGGLKQALSARVSRKPS